MNSSATFSPRTVCAYLYLISRYGYPPAAEGTISYLEEMAEMGFQSVELEGIHAAHIQAMYEQRTDIRAAIDRLGLQLPYYCVVLPNLGSADAKTREIALAQFEVGCETAQALGASGVLDNAPLPPYQFPAGIPITRHYDEKILLSAPLPANLNWDQYWQDLVSTYQTACEIAHSKGLTYHLHPCLGVLAATTDAYLYFADAVKRDNLRFTLDTANQFVMKDSLVLSLHRLKDHIDYLHISDNGGLRVEHLALGEGVIAWEPFWDALEAIDYRGHIGIDIGGAESDVPHLKKAYLDAANEVERRLR